MQNFSIHLLSEEEEGLYLNMRVWRDKIFWSLCDFLARKKVTPNMLSFAGLCMLPFFVYFFFFNPWISFFFLGLNIFFDAIDGVLARFLKMESDRGALLDIAFDQVSYFVVFLTFVSFSLVSSFWGAVYLFHYPVFIILTILLRALRVKFFLVIHNKYFIFFTFLLWLLSGENYFDAVIGFFSIYMVITNIFLFYKLLCSLR